MHVGSLRGPGTTTLVAALLSIVVVDVVEDAPNQVPPLLARQHFGEEICPVLQGRYVSGEAFLECYGLTNKMMTDTI